MNKIIKDMPIIAITMDSEDSTSYSKYPWYALRKNYCQSISSLGGIPLAIPHEENIISNVINISHGLIITGGAFDINPSHFGESKNIKLNTKESRTQFELKITSQAIDADIPVLGICGGEQLLNVLYGGTLLQHIPDEVNKALQHEQENPRNEPSHQIRILEKTQLRRILKVENFYVNSAHHQAVKTAGNGLTINAIAPDGVIEGIEDKSKKFCIGVQWHPEFLIGNEDKNLFESFIEEAIKNKNG